MKSRKKSRNSHCKEIARNLENLNCGLYGSWMNGKNCKTVQNLHCHPTGHAVEFNNSATINDDDVGSDLDGGDSEDGGNGEDDTHRDTQLAILADCNVPLLLYKCSGRPI